MRTSTDMPYTTMDGRDLQLWALIAAPTFCFIWAGELWMNWFDRGLWWRSTLFLIAASFLAVLTLLGAPPLASRIGGKPLGRAMGRGLTLSLILFSGTTAVLEQGNRLWWEHWVSSGAICGAALGLGWLTALRRYRPAWLFGSILMGIVAGLFSTAVSSTDLSGRNFAAIWVAIGLPLAWQLRSLYAPEISPVKHRISWRSIIPGGGLLLACVALIGVSAALRSCGPLANLLRPANCVTSLDIGALRNIHSLAFSPDGTSIFIGGTTPDYLGTIEQRSLTDNQVLARYATAERIWHIAISPSGSLLAAIDDSPTMYVWDTSTQQELHRIPATQGDLLSAPLFSPDEQFIVFREQTYNLNSGEVAGRTRDEVALRDQVQLNSEFIGIGYTPDKRFLTAEIPWDDARLAAAGYAYAYDIGFVPAATFDTPRARQVTAADAVMLFEGPISQSAKVQFSPDGIYMAVIYDTHYVDLGQSGIDYYLQIWRTDSGELLLREKLAPFVETYTWASHEPIFAISDMFGPVRLIRVGR